VFIEELKYTRHPRCDHASMISAGNFMILVPHIQFLQFVGPSAGIGDRNSRIRITLND
jgi:hypothetical protein